MNDEVVVDTDVFSRVVLAARPSPGYEGFVPFLQGVRVVLVAQTVGELLFGERDLVVGVHSELKGSTS